jgi:homoserine O-acetyltransferase
MTQDHEIYDLGDVTLQSGAVLRDAKLAYKTHGALNAARDNVIVIPTYYTGTHVSNDIYIETMPALDPERYFIISINMFGNGVSSSPSNTPAPQDGPRFPSTTLHDNVACQHRLLAEKFGVTHIALVVGWSMAACQSYQWGAQFPDMMDAILPYCGSARTSPHNIVFLDGAKAALEADSTFNGGDYTAPPKAGLKAFARVYAGWGFSQAFYRDGHYREQGYDTIDELLLDWEVEHLEWDANDLLHMLWSWQNGDISANDTYGGNFESALGAIRARAILMPCTTDLYFPPADNEIELGHMPNAELRPFDSPWGHCVASPGERPEFSRFLNDAIAELLTS